MQHKCTYVYIIIDIVNLYVIKDAYARKVRIQYIYVYMVNGHVSKHFESVKTTNVKVIGVNSTIKAVILILF